MTREEAIKRLKVLTDYEYDEDLEALDMAIKALEQEDVLDKIKDEINSLNRGTCDYFIVDRIEEIINKHKAESEDKE